MRQSPQEIARLLEKLADGLRISADRIENQLSGSQVAPPSGGGRGTVAFSASNPAANTNAGAVGTAGDVNRSDHSHPTGLTLKEADNSPTIANVVTIIVPNGSLTDNGSGSGTLAFASSAMDVLTTRGDLLTRDATTHVRLPIGTAGKYLRSDGTDPSWATLDMGDAGAGTLAVARGGTGLASYAVGDLIYASGATTLSKLADVATGNALISGGVTTAPAWGKIGLTTHISGILGLANGGTAADLSATGGANQIVRQNSAGGAFTVSTLAKADLPAAVAYEDEANLFTVNQTVTRTVSTAAEFLRLRSSASHGATAFVGNTGSSGDYLLLFSNAEYASGDYQRINTSYAAGAVTLGPVGITALAVNYAASGANPITWTTLFDLTTAGDATLAGALTLGSPLSSVYGGTGINNGGRTLTIGSNSGTLTFSAGSLTLTVPATGTAALLATANTFTAAQSVTIDDATTNATVVALNLTHTTSGTALNNIGTGIAVFSETDGGTTRQIAAVNFTFPTVADATRKGRARFFVYDTAARTCLDMEASGTAAMIGFLGAGAVVRQTVAAAAPAGGTGTAAGGYDTAAHRDALITLVNDMRSALIAFGLCV